MPKPKPKPKAKAAKWPKHIEANSITLVDDEGNPRISLDAGGSEGYASIAVFAKDGKSIQISAQANNDVSVMLTDLKGVNIQIHMASEGSSGIWVSDRKGLPGAILGETPGASGHRLLLFKNGKQIWAAPTAEKKRAGSREKLKSKNEKQSANKPRPKAGVASDSAHSA